MMQHLCLLKFLLHIPKLKKKINCLLPKALDASDYWTAAIIVDNGSFGITALPQHAHAKRSVFYDKTFSTLILSAKAFKGHIWSQSNCCNLEFKIVCYCLQ